MPCTVVYVFMRQVLCVCVCARARTRTGVVAHVYMFERKPKRGKQKWAPLTKDSISSCLLLC